MTEKDEIGLIKELRTDFYKGLFFDMLRLVKKDKMIHSDEVRLMKEIFDKDFKLGDGFTIKMIGLSDRLEGILKEIDVEKFLEKWIKFAHSNDGFISGNEYEMLYKIAVKFGVSDEKFEELIAPYNNGKKILFAVYDHLLKKYKEPFDKSGYNVFVGINEIKKRPNVLVLSPRVEKEEIFDHQSTKISYAELKIPQPQEPRQIKTGYDICKKLKLSNDRIPIVIVGHDIIEERCKEAGADAFSRDYTACELLRIVTDLQKRYSLRKK